MTTNHFYEKRGPFPLNEIVKTIGCVNKFAHKNNIEIQGLESLINASKKDMTFLNSSKYKEPAPDPRPGPTGIPFFFAHLI